MVDGQTQTFRGSDKPVPSNFESGPSAKDLNKKCSLDRRRHPLEGHMKIQSDEQIQYCNNCRLPFTKMSDLLNHQEKHGCKKPPQCQHCQKSFKDKLKLQAHMKTHKSDDQSYKCEVCEKTFAMKCELKKHRATHTGAKPFQCDICQQQFTQKSSLKTHVKLHSGLKPFTCPICGKSFAVNGNLKQHLKVHTGEKNFKCEECGRSFISAKVLSIHSVTHTGVRAFMCETCPETFSQKAALRRHMRVHTGERPHKCSKCDKTFTRKCYLAEHMASHTGELLFSCDVCGKTFRSAASFCVHKKIHSVAAAKSDGDAFASAEGGDKDLKRASKTEGANRVFECKLCPKKYTSLASLCKHKKIHSDEKPFQCDLCSKAFFFSQHLAVHVRTHTGEKPYTCKICSRKFATSSALSRHEKTHRADKPYKCDMCNKQFALTVYLKVHMKTHGGSSSLAPNANSTTVTPAASSAPLPNSNVETPQPDSRNAPTVNRGCSSANALKPFSSGHDHSIVLETENTSYSSNSQPDFTNSMQEQIVPTNGKQVFNGGPTTGNNDQDSSPKLMSDGASHQLDYSNLKGHDRQDRCEDLDEMSDHDSSDVNWDTEPEKKMPSPRKTENIPDKTDANQAVSIFEVKYEIVDFLEASPASLCDDGGRLDQSEKVDHISDGPEKIDPNAFTSHDGKKSHDFNPELKTEDKVPEDTYLPDTSDHCNSNHELEEKVEIKSEEPDDLPFAIELPIEDILASKKEAKKRKIMVWEEEDKEAKAKILESHAEPNKEKMATVDSLSEIGPDEDTDDWDSFYDSYPAQDKDLTCHVCYRVLRNARALANHLKNNCDNLAGKSDVITCTEKQLRRRPPATCDICGQTFEGRVKLKAHLINDHPGEKPYKCATCHKAFSMKSALKRHQLVHTGEKPFICEICNKGFTRSCYLSEHRTVHTGEKLFSCDACGKEFRRAACFHLHKKTHHGGGGGNQPVKLEDDDLADGEPATGRDRDSSAMGGGEKTQPPPRHFQCEMCPKAYASSAALYTHKKTHTGNKAFKCDMCPKSFYVMQSLTIHLRTHTGEKPFTCRICAKRFSHKSLVYRHERTHTNEKPFKCDICQKGFALQVYLDAHKPTHSLEKQFKCEVCDKRFGSMSTLSKHRKTHMNT